ncbi:MAG: regulatory iron-sulfur-containing complex subunit RicT [Chthonomonadales bacterium]
MPEAVGVAFKRVARSYWFDPGAMDFKDFDRVLVETTRGVELGTVRVTKREVPETEIEAPLKPVLRMADQKDIDQEVKNKEKAKAALALCKEKAAELELPMRLVAAEYTFDGSQVTAYFSAEKRVDFRGLVKVVAAQLRCKVQFHQLAARDQAKMVGGIGPCGLTLCCSTFLTEFAPISMKMAKDQSLFLNPVKYSGVCGKLMCCLRYEQDNYVEGKARLPQIGETVMTPKGQGRVQDVNIIKEEVSVLLSGNPVHQNFAASEVTVEKTSKCPNCKGCGVAALKADHDEAYSDGTPEELDLSELED